MRSYRLYKAHNWEIVLRRDLRQSINFHDCIFVPCSSTLGRNMRENQTWTIMYHTDAADHTCTWC
jgi:translation elongation factor EF-1alpha